MSWTMCLPLLAFTSLLMTRRPEMRRSDSTARNQFIPQHSILLSENRYIQCAKSVANAPMFNCYDVRLALLYSLASPPKTAYHLSYLLKSTKAKGRLQLAAYTRTYEYMLA